MAQSVEYADFRIVAKCPSGSKKNSSTYDSSTGITRYRFTLGEVQSWNINLDVIVGNGWTRITLKEIPRFLFDAFDILMERGLALDGLFRKEGNSARLNRLEIQDIYRGACAIPSDFTVYDVCTMIKRFLRDLKPTLLNSAKFRNKLLEKAAHAKNTGEYKLSHPEMVELFESSNSTQYLSCSHLGTLGYCMRLLARIGKHSEKHKMTIDNLAVVLVGSVFGDFMGGGTASRKKTAQNRRCSQDHLKAKKEDMEIQVAAVKLLIVNSNLIGLPKGHYVSSNRLQAPYVRSTSAMPNIRCGSVSDSDSAFGAQESGSNCVLNAAKASMSQRAMVFRRDSDLTHVKNLKERDVKMHKRSSSSFLPSLRGLRDKVSNQFLKRNKSPSPDRPKLPLLKSAASFIGSPNFFSSSPSPSPRTSTDPFFKTELQPVEKCVFDDIDDDSPSSPTSRPILQKRNRNSPSVSDSIKCSDSIGSTSSGRKSRSVHARRDNTNAVFSRNSINLNDSYSSVRESPTPADKKSVSASSSAVSTLTSHSLRRISQSEQNSSEKRMLKRRDDSESSSLSSSANTVKNNGQITPPTVKRKKKLGAIGRRNTIEGLISKSSKLRTNKIGMEPQRRATCWEVAPIAEEKENVRDSLILKNESENEEVFEETKLDASKSILEMMSQQARRRRIGVAERKSRNAANSESMMVLNGSMAVFEKSPYHTKKVLIGNENGNEEPVVKWRERKQSGRDEQINRRIECIDEKNLISPVLDTCSSKSPCFARAHPTMEQYLMAATSSTEVRSPPGTRLPISGLVTPTTARRKADIFATPTSRRRISEKKESVLSPISVGVATPRPLSIPLKHLDSIGLKQNGLAWVGTKQTVVSSPQPPRRISTDGNNGRALSAAPKLEIGKRSSSPLFVKPNIGTPRAASPVIRKALEPQRFASSKTISPLVVRSKSHLCDEKVLSKEYAAFATPPRTRRAQSPPRPSNLLFSTPNMGRRVISPTPLGLSTSSRPILKSTSSLVASPFVKPQLSGQHSLENRVVEKRSEDEDKGVFKCPILPPMKSHEKIGHRKTKSIDESSNCEEKEKKQPRHASSSVLEREECKSRSSSRISSVFEGGETSDSEFCFGDFNEVVKAASDEANLPMHKNVEARPSVTLLRSSNCGLVQSRINQFQGLEQKSRNSMDTTSTTNTSGRLSHASQKSTETVGSGHRS